MEGGDWSSNIPLYVSPYFRGLTDDELNVSISTTHTDQGEVIYVSWDNPGLKRIFFTRSDDRGLNWTLPNEVDNPSSTLGTDTPFDILLNPDGDQVLAVWKSGEPGVSCVQVYKTSDDRGITWSDRAHMLQEISGCPQSNQFIPGPDGNPILITSIQDQVYLLSWNGKEWSDAQPQPELNGFENPDTLGTIQFRCRKPAMSAENLLYVIGCEQGGGADTWVLSKPITSVENWFPTAVSWEGPEQIITQTVVAQSPVLISDPQGITHALWTQADESSSDSAPAAIYYSRNNNGTWITPVSILTSPEGKADQVSVAQDSRGRLMVTWVGGQSGDLYFSWANAGKAAAKSEWSEATKLPVLHPTASSPDILIDGLTVYVAYAIPLNEDRGIYIIRSEDGGVTWSDPIRVFDGAVAGWDQIDHPRLAMTEDGGLHILWTREPLPGWGNSLGIYYARSMDQGRHLEPS